MVEEASAEEEALRGCSLSVLRCPLYVGAVFPAIDDQFGAFGFAQGELAL